MPLLFFRLFFSVMCLAERQGVGESQQTNLFHVELEKEGKENEIKQLRQILTNPTVC